MKYFENYISVDLNYILIHTVVLTLLFQVTAVMIKFRFFKKVNLNIFLILELHFNYIFHSSPPYYPSHIPPHSFSNSEPLLSALVSECIHEYAYLYDITWMEISGLMIWHWATTWFNKINMAIKWHLFMCLCLSCTYACVYVLLKAGHSVNNVYLI